MMTHHVPTDAQIDWRSWDELELPTILACARDAFYETGYHGTSVRDLASRVGVTVPAIYYHYENKEALLLAILDASISHLTRLCVSAVEAAGPDADDRFFNLVECITLYQANAGRTASIDGELRLLSPKLRATYAEKRKHVEDLLLTAVDDGVENDLFECTSAKDTTRAILGMLQAIPIWYRPGGEFTPQDLAVRYTDICAHTVGASATVLDKARQSR